MPNLPYKDKKNQEDIDFQAFDGDLYKKNMRYFGSAAHIVTTGGASGRRGLTISACCSLSNMPPTLLCCVYRSENNRYFVQNKNFCVNTLALRQKDIASVFAGCTKATNEERFEHGEWIVGKTGAPILKDALMSIDCQLTDIHEYETHYILLGRVVDMVLGQEEEALMYLNCKFHGLPLNKV